MKKKTYLIKSEEAITLLKAIGVDGTVMSLADITRKLNFKNDVAYTRILEAWENESNKPKKKRSEEFIKLLAACMDAWDGNNPISVVN